MPHATAPPAIRASQPPGTSVGEMYLSIIKNVMGKFSPTGKMSDILTHIADKFREEEKEPSPISIDIPTDAAAQTNTSATQNPSPAIDPAKDNEDHDDDAEFEEEVEIGDEGNSQGKGEAGAEEEEKEGRGNEEESFERNSTEKAREVVVLEEGGSTDDEETLDERAVRRNLRTRRKLETDESRDTLKETAAIAKAAKQATEQKRKGKQVATPSQKRKPQQASKSVVIKEPVEDLTKPPYSQVEEQSYNARETSDSVGVYEKLEVEVDLKLLEAMVYFKDPKKRKDCAGRVLKGKKAKSGKRLHIPSL